MATDNFLPVARPMTVAELIAHTKKELDADASEKQAKLLAASVGELPKESQTGATLDLSRQNISALPVELIELIKDRVERLALSHNPSVALPSQIVQCERIRYLNIRWNDLDRFPEAVLQLTKLEILDLSKNNIKVIPDGIRNLTSLKFLAVARNNIRRLPLALGDMPSLSKLKFDENPIEFPPPDAIKLPKRTGASSQETEREKEVCRAVKHYLKDMAAKQKVKAADEEMSESNVETPRPPKRTATIGRFPIRPSISGLPNGLDPKSGSPSAHPPPIPQRSHARVASTTSSTSLTPPTPKRPGIAPLRTNGNDITRSQSETAASASLRQRRQGYVPKRERKVTGPLNPLTEAPGEAGDRLSQSSMASTVKPTHSRATSSLSTVSSFLVSSGGESSSGATSPVDTGSGRSTLPRTRPTLANGLSKDSTAVVMKVAERLAISFAQLQRPIFEVMVFLEGVSTADPTLRSCVSEANANASRIEGMLTQARIASLQLPTKAVLHRTTHALKAYLAVTASLKRSVSNIVRASDAIYTRCLMLQIYASVMEARNLCTILGFQIKERANQRDTLRASKAWSSRTVTPTQPKIPTERRARRPTVLPRDSTAPTTTIRAMAPPPLPLPTNGSRTNTLPSISSATPRSNESFGSLASSRPNVSRTNTMRSMMDIVEPDDQFEHIFLKLRVACEQAGTALSACRVEFVNRREQAVSFNQPRPAHHWTTALTKCDIASNHNKTLRKRLEMVKVNDPSVRFQRDFWQLCDAFVHSWIDLATEIKDLGAQRVDVTSAKQIMRNVQKLVKDVSKTISHSPLYHHALGTKMAEPDSMRPLAPAFPAGLGNASTTSLPSAHHNMASGSGIGAGAQNPYITSLPATPLSAALGPAAHAVSGSTAGSMISLPGYFQDPQATSSSRAVHERNDTVMQAPGRQRRQI